MIRPLTIEDADAINALMRCSSIYPYIIDDGCPENPEDFDASGAIGKDGIHYIGWFDGDHLVGLWIFLRWSAAMFQGHVCLLPNFRGKRGIDSSAIAVQWMFDNTPCRKIMALVPEESKAVIGLVRSMGFAREGRLRKSFLKDGRLFDEIVFGYSGKEGD